MSNSTRYRYSIKRVAIAIAALVAVIITFIYLLFAIYFQSHFFFGTTINGIDCSGKSVMNVEEMLKKDTRYYVLQLIERDNVVEHISAESINMSIVLSESVASVKAKQNPYAWFFKKNDSFTIPTTISYNETLLQEKIDNLKCANPDNMRKPSVPYLVYENGAYTVKSGDAGTELNVELLSTLIKNAVKDGKTSINLEESGCYLVDKTDETSKLYELEGTLNGYINTKIELVFGENTEVIDRNLISQWISLSDDTEIVFDEKAILNYVTSLAKKYETFGCTREFTNSYGKTIIVKGGDYGWWFNKNG